MPSDEDAIDRQLRKPALVCFVQVKCPITVGAIVGAIVGGAVVGVIVGRAVVGVIVGGIVGGIVGRAVVGAIVGAPGGLPDGRVEGILDGAGVGAFDGVNVGASVGLLVGEYCPTRCTFAPTRILVPSAEHAVASPYILRALHVFPKSHEIRTKDGFPDSQGMLKLPDATRRRPSELQATEFHADDAPVAGPAPVL